MKGRIFLNDNIFFYEARRGVSRYFRAITKGVIDHFGENVTIFSPEVGDYGAAKHICPPQFRGSRYFRIHDLVASFLALRDNTSLYFSPYYGHTWTKAVEIYAVYDMIYELFPRYFLPSDPLVRRFTREKKRCIERATAIIASSKSTAVDIINCYPHIDQDKIVVIPLGVEGHFFRTHLPLPAGQSRPFFLYIGNRNRYKNFRRLLNAFGESGLATEFDLRVISPGPAEFDLSEIELINRFKLQGRVHLLLNVDEEEVCRHYATAVALIYPSEYEGFGLPLLEAMASGTLVASSNTSSMPEVGGDIPFYFDPSATESITSALKEIAALSTQDRHNRIRQGILRARQFSWQQCQEQTVELFQKIL
jgi:glycosyltransferase involved in cell wall biosynthesis